jgi:tetratricopeptide (TPR) repeat protein
MCDAMRLGSRVWWIALFSLGCVQAPTPFGGAWKEARSRHFVVQSDLDERELTEYAIEFEASYSAIRSCLYSNGSDLSGESRVVLFRDWSEYALVQHENSDGHFLIVRNQLETSSTIVLPARAHDRMFEVFQHELTHRFVHHYFPAAPPWLDEGLAGVFSTLSVEDDGVVVGRPLGYLDSDGAGLTIWGRPLSEVAPPAGDLFAMDYGTFLGEALAYSGSWALVHTLLLGEPAHRKTFEAYLSELRAGAVSERQAFARHFDAGALPEVERAYRARLGVRDVPMFTFPKSAESSTEVAIRPLGEAEAFALWGRLRPRTTDGLIEARRDADKAIAAEPKSPEGYLLRAAVNFKDEKLDEAIADARRALALSPDDPRLLRTLGALLLEKKEKTEELERVAKKLLGLARSADDFAFLARIELSKKNPTRGLELALEGMKRDPTHVTCLEIAARAAFRMGDAEQAVRLQEKALHFVSERDSDVRGMLRKLAKYRKQLAQTPRVP